MTKKSVIGFMVSILLVTGMWLAAQVNQSDCNTCTAGYAIDLNGDVQATGNMIIRGTTTNTGAITNSGAVSTTGLTTVSGGITQGALSTIADTASLTSASCGKHISVTAGIDTKTITLPLASSVPGCTYTLHYVGADGGALLDITPLDSGADGIEGGCTLAASVVTFSGTADADIGLTKATGLTGDTITLTACGAAMWCASACQGIWANN